MSKKYEYFIDVSTKIATYDNVYHCDKEYEVVTKYYGPDGELSPLELKAMAKQRAAADAQVAATRRANAEADRRWWKNNKRNTSGSLADSLEDEEDEAEDAILDTGEDDWIFGNPISSVCGSTYRKMRPSEQAEAREDYISKRERINHENNMRYYRSLR